MASKVLTGTEFAVALSNILLRDDDNKSERPFDLAEIITRLGDDGIHNVSGSELAAVLNGLISRGELCVDLVRFNSTNNIVFPIFRFGGPKKKRSEAYDIIDAQLSR
ncbi:MAG: hypothetical protein Q7S32_04965 [bacterium]|nr:hypothetical protein [bacterium]